MQGPKGTVYELAPSGLFGVPLSCPLLPAVGLEDDIFPKTTVDAACLARLPKAWPFSGRSMPLRRIPEGRSRTLVLFGEFVERI